MVTERNLGAVDKYGNLTKPTRYVISKWSSFDIHVELLNGEMTVLKVMVDDRGLDDKPELTDVLTEDYEKVDDELARAILEILDGCDIHQAEWEYESVDV